MTKVVLCGYYGQGNVGDEALLLTLLQMLPPTAEPIVLSHNPAQTAQAYGVKTAPHKSFATLQAIATADWFVWGGGSLMQDVSSLASSIYYAGLMKWAQLMGKKTLAWGQGIGPLNTPLARYLTRICLSHCHGISVRDQASAQLLEKWRIPHRIAPDPVWALTAQPLDYDLDLPQPRIAVNLRSHASLTPEKITVICHALTTLQTQLNASIILVPFQRSQDQAIAEQLYHALAEPKTIVALTRPEQFKSLFTQVDWLIGMRLHSLIMAAAVGCPCFALSYDPKVTQLQQQCQLAGLDLTHFSLDAAQLTEQWLTAFHQRQGLTLEQQNEIQQQVEQHHQLLTQLA